MLSRTYVHSVYVRSVYVRRCRTGTCTGMHTGVHTGMHTGKLYTVGFRSAVSYGGYTYATDMGYGFQ